MSDADQAPLFFLGAQRPLNPLAAVADLLDLHRRSRLPRLLPLVPYLVVLTADHARGPVCALRSSVAAGGGQ